VFSGEQVIFSDIHVRKGVGQGRHRCCPRSASARGSGRGGGSPSVPERRPGPGEGDRPCHMSVPELGHEVIIIALKIGTAGAYGIHT
jgi:hypothetical protein